ncbi:MAG: RNA 2'-phosphotransferase [Deinococcaceae bacterium]
MKDFQDIRISKVLSYHLRHHPDQLGLQLQQGGWVDVDDLLSALRKAGFLIDRATLKRVVLNNDKQRFSFDENELRIRANQGHSVQVDLELQPTRPPEVLYHGTPKSSVPSILVEGLKPMNRHHVHLSHDRETAQKVGARRGKPEVLEIKAQSMFSLGYPFYISANGVWLTPHVPPEFIRRNGNI